MQGSQELVLAFVEAAYLLARFHPPALVGTAGGRQWERWAASTLGASGAWIRQGPGRLTLFGTKSASGLGHELDGGAARGSTTLILEAKAYSDHGPSKEDLMYFDRKTFDLFIARRRTGERGPHYRVLASTQAMEPAFRKYSFLYGIIAVEPDVLPIPLLLQMAGRPVARRFFQGGLLADFLCLGTVACGPLESRFVPDGPHHLRFDISMLLNQDLDDLLWLQQELSADVLELVDQERPGHFEGRADQLLDTLGIQPICSPY